MKDLIEAFQIFAKYTQAHYPTGCEHDRLYVMVSPSAVSEGDIQLLEKLGFYAGEEDDNFYSFRFGSC